MPFYKGYNLGMPLSIKQVEHIAKLARLELTEAQTSRYRDQLEAILNHVAKLQELDTTDVPSTASGTSVKMPLRPDTPRPGLLNEELLANAPQQEGGQFKIPPVFE